MTDKFDTIIAGAGLAGLTCAAFLLQEGKRVLVVEKNSQVGGFATHLKKGAFQFDFSLHNFGAYQENTYLKEIFNKLGLDQKLEFTPFNEYQRLIFPEHDFVIEKGLDHFIDQMNREFPSQTKGIKKIIKIFNKIEKEFTELEKTGFLLSEIEKEIPMFPFQFPSIVTLKDQSLAHFLKQYIEDEKLQAIFANLWWLFGIPDQMLSAVLYAAPMISYYQTNGGYFKGISAGLEQNILENQGRILKNSPIKKFILENNTARGIVLENGEHYAADQVISNINSYTTFNDLIGQNQLDSQFVHHIASLEQSLSAIQIYLGLNIPAQEIPFPEHSLALFQSYDHRQNYQWVLDEDYNNCFLCITHYHSRQEKSCPQDQSIIHILTLAHIKNWISLSEVEVENRIQLLKKILLQRVSRFIPGIQEKILQSEVATPLTFKHYSGHPLGSIYGISQIPSQAGINRLSHLTPINNLYLTGADTFPGAGYQSVISSGYKLAQHLIKKSNSRSDNSNKQSIT